MYEIIDNFLPEKEFLTLKDLIFSEKNKKHFPWVYQKGIVKDPKLGLTDYEEYNWIFVCLLYDCAKEGIKIKKHFRDIQPIIKKLNKQNILRAQINGLVPTDKHIYHQYHTDRSSPHSVGLFYITTCNGYTEILDTAKIDCVENRMLIFDGNLQHRSVTSTDNFRCVLNLNFK